MTSISPAPVEACKTTWEAPECPFTIEWSAAVLEEIREAAVDAFFSVPYGGVEIGGVLFGTRDGDGVRILASRPVKCEHALGPTFTLSEKDHTRFRAVLEEGRRDLRAQGLEPVGWHHSHTRSEIFLSAQDVAIYNRYFPEPWQVALVLRPQALKPVRAGFFFREDGGYLHADSSYCEFPLKPATGAPTPQVERPAPTGPDRAAAPTEPPSAPVSVAIPLPAFLRVTPRRRSWRWLRWAAPVPLIVASGAGLFAFRADWMPLLTPRPQPPALSLVAYDLEGQLQIRWDRGSEPIRSAAAGTLQITDGAVNTVVALDKGLLHCGTVGYARQNARVDVRLTVDQPGGKTIEAFAAFLGRAPAGRPETDRSTGAEETLREELRAQTVRTRWLERAIGEMRAEIRREQELRRNVVQAQPKP